MIRTKEDFEGKYIKLPKNLSEKKFNKIKAKFKRLGFNTKHLDHNSYECVFIWEDSDDIGNWNQNRLSEQIKNPQEISIKDFLRDKSDGYTIELGLDSITLKVDVIDIGLKVKYKDYNKKEKPKTFKTEKEAIKWCHKNPMKEISYDISGNLSNYKERYNPKTGTLGLESCFEFKHDESDWQIDEDCLSEAKNGNKWINIMECK